MFGAADKLRALSVTGYSCTSGKMGRRTLVCRVLCGFFGLACLVTGCVLITVFKNLIHDEIDTSLPLKNGSESYKNWLSPPAPIYFQIWVYDVQNYLEVLATGQKPVLVQKGPYTYRERRKKVNITYTENSTITYRENRWFTFEPSMSNGTESDNFTTVSLPMITLVNMLRFEYSPILEALSWFLKMEEERLFVTLTPGGLLWGYEDNLLKKAKDFLARFNISLPIPDKFGLFYNQNGTDDGLYKIYTGADTTDHFGEILTWNKNKTLSYWSSQEANMINGSDGTLYPPFVDTSKQYYLFSSDLCRSLVINYSDSYTLKGIDLKRFKVPREAFVNTSYDSGFCTPNNANCLPSGFLNASACREGAPIVFSLPHFLDADPEMRNRVIGLNPIREQHQSVIDIEPMTGVVMNAAKRLQINAYLTNISHIEDLKFFKEFVILPILWLNESATIDDKSAHDFKDEVLTKLKITEAVKFGLIALGGLILLIVIALFAKGIRCKQMDKEMVDVSERTPILGAS